MATLIGLIIYHCGFDLHIPNDYWCWTCFHIPAGHLSTLDKKCSFSLFSYLKWGSTIAFCYGVYIANINFFKVTWVYSFSYLVNCFHSDDIHCSETFHFSVVLLSYFRFDCLGFWCVIPEIIAYTSASQSGLYYVLVEWVGGSTLQRKESGSGLGYIGENFCSFHEYRYLVGHWVIIFSWKGKPNKFENQINMEVRYEPVPNAVLWKWNTM